MTRYMTPLYEPLNDEMITGDSLPRQFRPTKLMIAQRQLADIDRLLTMERIVLDIALEICNHLDCFSILSWMRSCSHMRQIWLQMTPFTRIIRNCKQFDLALRDKTCCLMLITGKWIAFNEYTKDTDIPPRHINIIGYPSYCISLKMESEYPLSITLRHIRPYQILLDTPYWDLTLVDTVLDSNSRSRTFLCNNVYIYDSSITGTSDRIEKSSLSIRATNTIVIDKLNTKMLQTTKPVSEIYLSATHIRLNNLVAPETEIKLSSNHMNVSNSQIGFIYIDDYLDTQDATITDCVFSRVMGFDIPIHCKLKLKGEPVFYNTRLRRANIY